MGLTQLGVLFHAGEVQESLRTPSAAVVESLRTFADQLNRASDLRTLTATLQGRTRALGAPTINLGHGVGVDELGWSFSSSPARRLVAGDSLAVHPSCQPRAVPTRAFAAANTFVLGDDGAEALSRLPFDVQQLPLP